MNDVSQHIFVMIAAYRDRDCPNTIRDLFAKARWPERVSIGLCWQYLSPDDDDFEPVPVRKEQVRVTKYSIDQGEGVCWARNKVQGLWQGEGYALQIDSHMRFVEHWDEKCLAMLAACPSAKPVLSNYPGAFTPPDQIDSHIVSVIHANGFDPDGMLKQGSVGHPPEKFGPIPQSAAFCAGGFIFGAAGWIQDVPYDPFLYFQGEEITMGVRLFSHGWDIFVPTDVICYHDYNNRPDRPRHWNDRKDWTKLNDRSLRRVRHLLEMEHSFDADVTRDIDLYGLGTTRSLADFERLTEIDFKARTVRGKTTAELESEAPPAQKRPRHSEIFTHIWRQNSWGDAETRSGGGSTHAATAWLRPQIVELFRFLGVKRLIDAGCGDLNWMGLISEMFDFYLGLDLVPELIAEVEKRYATRPGHFFALRDIAIDDLPPADAIFCRDVLTHFPSAEVKAALSRFKASGATYLIATTHALGQNREINMGEWQPIDLTAAPYGLGVPYLTLFEQQGQPKALGVWRLENLPLV